MILHIAKTNQTIIHDFFGDAPKLRQSEVEGLDFYPIELDYGPTTQRFYVGRGAAGVPGVLPGLCSALDNWGTLPLSKVIAPACRLLRDGAVIGAGQAALAEFLEPILTETEAGRDMFAPDGNYISEGATFRLPDSQTLWSNSPIQGGEIITMVLSDRLFWNILVPMPAV